MQLHVFQVLRRPAALGGMTSHVQDLAHALSEVGTDSVDIDVGSAVRHSLRSRWRVGPRRRVVYHVHVSRPDVAKALLLGGLLRTLRGSGAVVTTFHHGSVLDHLVRPLMRRAWRFAVGAGDVVVALNPELLAGLTALEATARVAQASSLVAIPTSGPDVEPGPGPQRRSPTVLLSSGMETDLYGHADVLVAARDLEVQEDMDVVVHVCTYGPARNDHVAGLQATADQLGVRVRHDRDLSRSQVRRAIREADVLVRNTATDSYGLVVAEALAMGTPVVATDVAERPEGTVVYPAGIRTELVKSLRVALEQGVPDVVARVLVDDVHRNVRTYRDIYEAALAARGLEPTPKAR